MHPLFPWIQIASQHSHLRVLPLNFSHLRAHKPDKLLPLEVMGPGA